jgi:hypothetical protein
MKFIADNTVSSVALSSGSAMGAFPVGNVTTDQPRQSCIGTSTTIVITASLSGASTAFSMINFIADSGTYAIDGGSATAFTSSELENKFGFNPWGQGVTSGLKKSLFKTMSGSSSLAISLTTSTDIKGSPLDSETNGITNWVQTSGVQGYFTDGSNPVNLNNHGQVKLGSFVTTGAGTVYISKIIGSGDSSTNYVELSSATASASVTSITKPVQLGTLKVGTLTTISDPRSLSRSSQDYSTKSIGSNGSYQCIIRNVADVYSGETFAPVSEADNFIGIVNSRRGKPIPVSIINDGFSEKSSLSLFGSVSIGSENYMVRGTYRLVSFSITEAL